MNKIDFQITSIQGTLNGIDDEAISIFMRVNGKTSNCLTSIDCFKDKESAWLALEPMIKSLLDEVYGVK